MISPSKIIVVSTAVLLGVVLGISLDDGVKQVSAPVTNIGEWFRILATVVSVCATTYLAIRSQGRKELKDTIEIQTGNLAALDRENKRLKEEKVNFEKEIAELQRKYDVLAVKTDLTEVMEKIDKNNESSDKRYADAMAILGRTLDTLNTQGNSNTESITRILGIIDKRWKIEEQNGQTTKHR